MSPLFVYAETETLAFTASVEDVLRIDGVTHYRLSVVSSLYNSAHTEQTGNTLRAGDSITLPKSYCRQIHGKLVLREWDMAKTMRDAQARADDPGWTCEHSGLIFLSACLAICIIPFAFPSLTH